MSAAEPDDPQDAVVAQQVMSRKKSKKRASDVVRSCDFAQSIDLKFHPITLS